ncbi:nucleotidyltransferase family protein [endosymbiont of unidentified scaly snail isolate Monju]|uniref:hypothetical protein n=1 Tax=endosymbiont of unidentified scaly snail isolate Monju TaxID=1248727 RepID=UPI0011DD0CCF|nr:hypothetical protein [endosymbiont of unidentified scaly snail isolate Monju]
MKTAPWSDLDLVVFAGPAQKNVVAELREAFEENELPFRVDLFTGNLQGKHPQGTHCPDQRNRGA